MRSTLLLAAALLALLPAAGSGAHGYEVGDLIVRHPWTRATPPGSKVAAGYLEIRNSGRQPDRLIGASTPAAERVELHVIVHQGDIRRMRAVEAFDLPPRERLALRPGGPHLMIMGLKRDFAKGERVPLTLRFEKAGELRVELEVQAIDSRKPHH